MILLPNPLCALELASSLLTDLDTKPFPSFTQQDKFLSVFILLLFKETDLPAAGRRSRWVPDMQIRPQWQRWEKGEVVITNALLLIMDLFLLPTVTTALGAFFGKHQSIDRAQLVLGRLSLQPQDTEMCYLNWRDGSVRAYGSCWIVSRLSRQVCWTVSCLNGA